jgi:hypothetical protein
MKNETKETAEQKSITRLGMKYAPTQAFLSKRQYWATVYCAWFIYIVLPFFFRTRPAFDFFPYGLLILCLSVFCLLILARAHFRKVLEVWEFWAATGCCIAFIGYGILTAVVHLIGDQGTYGVLPLATVAFAFILWLGMKWGYWLCQPQKENT